MARAIDVVRYIVDQRGEMTAMKLHKLAYYCQAWHLVWRERELFPEDFQAWANGPVIRGIYAIHRRQLAVNAGTFSSGRPDLLTADERSDIDRVLSFYGDKTAQWLSNLTHKEAPWLKARRDLPPGASSESVIHKSWMHEYYSAL